MPVYDSSNALYSFRDESTDHVRSENEVGNEIDSDAVINNLYEKIGKQRKVVCARLNVHKYTVP